jgi:hypothetical protein
MIEYQIDVTDAYLLEGLARLRRSRRLRWLELLFLVFGAASIALVAVTSMMHGEWGLAIPAIPPAIFLLFFPPIADWIRRRRTLQSPYRGEWLNVLIEADGVRTESPSHRRKQLWAGYTRAVMLSDGILLYQAPGVVQWLPDDAIKSGSRELAESMIASHLSTGGKGEPGVGADSR